jgi:hypothetical protein
VNKGTDRPSIREEAAALHYLTLKRMPAGVDILVASCRPRQSVHVVVTLQETFSRGPMLAGGRLGLGAATRENLCNYCFDPLEHNHPLSYVRLFLQPCKGNESKVEGCLDTKSRIGGHEAATGRIRGRRTFIVRFSQKD